MGCLKGNPLTIKGMIRDCIMKAADSPRGFVLATGCEVPINTPHENMVAFLESWKAICPAADSTKLGCQRQHCLIHSQKESL